MTKAPSAAQKAFVLNLPQVRRWHGRLGPVLLVPLLNSAVTGSAYRIGKDWLGLPRDQVHWLMVLHEGEWLGEAGKTCYVLLEALGVLWLLVTGSVLAWKRLR